MASPKIEVFQIRDASTDAPITGRTMGGAGFVFSYYRDDTGVSVTAPTVTEIGGGFYKFTPTLPSDPNRGLVYDLFLGTNANPERITRYVRPEDWAADDAPFARKYLVNRRQVFTSGPNAGRLVIYEDDGTTIWKSWMCYAADGTTVDTLNPYILVPV